MINPEFPRDLLMTGAIFGLAAFIWSGWAQERPPKHWIWRVVLAVIGLGGAVLVGLSVPAAIKNWSGPTALEPGGPAFITYIVVFWIEVIAMIVLAIWASRRGRSDLHAPLILAVVGIHFIPLAWVFAQPIFAVAGVLVTIVAIVATRLPLATAARSFWCGLFGGAILLIVGAVCSVIGFGALG
ncbi:hypothetical protein FLP10_04705 [Agromyces intestinalis]|uniref:Uncharacterized protein n=1 Tax=Agromyces intestinalis TaxID=2592652 RepID=A0A5C1YCN7_9MICO|nr:hypothetical protein [Agromyces intestinalis]QEO13801.1 hypothetical protein FLP10_04705 [Agromyces intestinalis]